MTRVSIAGAICRNPAILLYGARLRCAPSYGVTAHGYVL